MWTSQSAMELQVPIPTIDIAVAIRDLSVLTTEREQVSRNVLAVITAYLQGPGYIPHPATTCVIL